MTKCFTVLLHSLRLISHVANFLLIESVFVPDYVSFVWMAIKDAIQTGETAGSLIQSTYDGQIDYTACRNSTAASVAKMNWSMVESIW